MFQLSGFAILIDRRNGSWQELSSVFYKIVSLFPGTVKEVFLLYKYPAGPSSHLATLTAEYSCREAHARTVGGE